MVRPLRAVAGVAASSLLLVACQGTGSEQTLRGDGSTVALSGLSTREQEQAACQSLAGSAQALAELLGHKGDYEWMPLSRPEQSSLACDVVPRGTPRWGSVLIAWVSPSDAFGAGLARKTAHSGDFYAGVNPMGERNYDLQPRLDDLADYIAQHVIQ